MGYFWPVLLLLLEVHNCCIGILPVVLVGTRADGVFVLEGQFCVWRRWYSVLCGIAHSHKSPLE